VVFDLDETLVHCLTPETEQFDIQLAIELPEGGSDIVREMFLNNILGQAEYTAFP